MVYLKAFKYDFRLFCDMGKGSSVVNLKRHHENRVKDGKTHPE